MSEERVAGGVAGKLIGKAKQAVATVTGDRDLAAEGDVVVCMGAGDITKWAAGLADAIKTERASKS